MTRSSLLLTAFAVGLCLLSVEARGRSKKGRHIPQRDGKLLSLFNVVTFQNDPCRSNAKTGAGNERNGTCFTASECTDKGGTNSGNCAAGFGVCCVFTIENSGDSINQNCSYIRNPGFPSTYSGDDTKFSHTINKCSCDVCFIRLDFEAFTILGISNTFETLGGVCVDTFMVTSGSGQVIPTICGQNNGKHMYIETGQGCSDTVSISTSFTGASTTRRWDIKASQIECTNAMVPPQGCLEYLTTAQGRITSFNWDTTGETHLASQRQKICVRSTRSSCCVQYTLCEDLLSFKFSGDIAIALAAVNSDCTADYIEANSFTSDCRPDGNSNQGVTRICGGVFNTQIDAKLNLDAICDCSPLFALNFVTDAGSETPEIFADPGPPPVVAADEMPNANVVNKGLCLDYSLINC